MVSIDSAIRFPFKQKNWKETVGIYFLILLGVSLISGVTQFFVRIPSSISQNSSNYNEGVAVAQVFLAMISMIVSFILFPITTYLAGYSTEATKNIMNGKEEIGKHGNYWERIKIGLIRYLISLFYGLPTFFMIIIALVFLIVGVTQQYSNNGIYTLGLVAFFSFLAIMVLWTAFVQPFFDKSALYEYLKTDKVSSIFNVSKVTNNIKDNFSAFLFMYGTDLLAGVSLFLSIITCCLMFLTQPAIQTIATFAKSYIDGNTFKQISEKK